ncbi:dephospho-CoA kinase [Candidatus Omnitrophota bacterium]
MIIGITGGFCSGKSEAAKVFKGLGAKVIDLDNLAHKALKPGTKSFKKIIKEFGRDLLTNNQIDRSLLAKEVFGSRKKLAKLNSIIHPIVIKRMFGLIKKSKKNYKIIAVEAPLLFEAGMKKYFDYIIVVKANKKNQIERAIRKIGIGKKDILKRINSQWPLKKKAAKADFIIDNNKAVKKMRWQIKEIWKNLISQ